MKNIFLLPTTGPSRIKGDGYSLELSSKALCWRFAKHIYITSSEEAVEGDWCIAPILDENGILHDIVYRINYDEWQRRPSTEKKIILTTDPILIEEGVQSINNGNIKWLIENHECEYVDVERGEKNYKIIIPEPKPNPGPVIDDSLSIEIIQSQVDCLQGILDKTNHLNDDGPTRYFVLMELQSLNQELQQYEGPE